MNKKDWQEREKRLLEGIEINTKNKISAEDGIEEGELVLASIRAKIKTFK